MSYCGRDDCTNVNYHHHTSTTDPAYSLLTDSFTSKPVESIYRESCYICTDPEFAQMGLPLCRKCPVCGGHISADDTECWDCGYEEGPWDSERGAWLRHLKHRITRHFRRTR